MARTSYAIALGSNRRHHRHGGPRGVLAAALAELERAGVRVTAAAEPIETAPVGAAVRRFANSAAIIETALAPPALLALLKRIEREFGRRRGRRWGDRVLDLDILLWSDGRFASHRLAVPHPRLAERRFVLEPLRRIAPDWRVPRAGRTVRQLAARLRRG